MNQKLKAQLDHAFALTYDLVAHLDEASLALDLPGLPSNRIAAQLWCVVGARESHIRAIKAGRWMGFSSGLETPRVRASVLAALEATRSALGEIDFASLTDAQLDLAFRLFEHEVQHHGQLIRFVYANRLTFPASWNRHYTV
jgi:hypothetical protein